MTRDQVNAILREMERLREDADEAEGKEQRRLIREYGLRWRVVELFVTGRASYDPDPLEHLSDDMEAPGA